MGFTANYANNILVNLFSGAYIGLSLTTPSIDGGNVTEPPFAPAVYNPDSENTYTRQLASNGDFQAKDGTITNQKYIYFPEAVISWGTPTHMCLFDNATGGTLRYFGALTSAQPVTANTVPLFKPKSISISLDAD